MTLEAQEDHDFALFPQEDDPEDESTLAAIKDGSILTAVTAEMEAKGLW